VNWPTLYAAWIVRDRRYGERRSGRLTAQQVAAIRFHRAGEIALLPEEERQQALEYLDRKWPA
jgi:hypothetical protein